MNEDTRRRLEAAGWAVGSPADFLELTPEEEAYIEIHFLLTEALKARRREWRWTRTALAHRLAVDADTVKDAEGGDVGVPIDFYVRALLALGASPTDVGVILGAGELSPAA